MKNNKENSEDNFAYFFFLFVILVLVCTYFYIEIKECESNGGTYFVRENKYLKIEEVK